MSKDPIKKFDEQQNLIFHAIIAAPLILYCIAYLQSLGDNPDPSFSEPPLMLKLFVSIFSGMLVLLAFFLFKNNLANSREKDTLQEKLRGYASAAIIKYAVLEMASIIAALAFFLTHDHLFTAIYVFILFLMSLNKPSPRKYANDLRLKGEERDVILNKKRD